MPSQKYDQVYVSAAASDIEEYLLSGVLYWPLSGRTPKGDPPLSRLTIGGLLLSQARLLAQIEVSLFSGEVADSFEKIAVVRDRWRSNWNKKAQEEISSRLKQWGNYLLDYQKDPGLQAREYPRNVYRRVILDLLDKEIGGLDAADQTVLAGLDRTLKSVFRKGSFCWEANLAGGFPAEVFWYLYGGLKD